MNPSSALSASLAALLLLSASACGSTDDTSSVDAEAADATEATTAATDANAAESVDPEPETVEAETVDPEPETVEAETVDPEPETVEAETVESTVDATAEGVDEATSGEPSSFEIEVWADNWMAVYVDGELIGEDSVPITTERSFNAETFVFEASLPFTIAIEAKDFKETDSGIEYIGEGNQQMGDGGIIAQVTDLTSGEVVAGTDAGWSALVVHQAPLNTECVRDADPDSTCEFLILDTPADWTTAGFDDSAWANATEWSAADVSPKDGYDEISWDPSAQLIWGTDLEIDNTVLLRATVS